MLGSLIISRKMFYFGNSVYILIHELRESFQFIELIQSLLTMTVYYFDLIIEGANYIFISVGIVSKLFFSYDAIDEHDVKLSLSVQQSTCIILLYMYTTIV